MFDHLLNDSSDDESDNILEVPCYTHLCSKSNISKAPSQHSLRVACDNFMKSIDKEESSVVSNLEQQRSDDPPISSSELSDMVNEEIILSVVYINNHVGGAYYNMQTSEIFVMDDVYDNVTNFTVTKALYLQCLPKQVITIKGSSPAFIKSIKEMILRNIHGAMENEAVSSATLSTSDIPPHILQELSKKEYSFHICQNRVLNLKLATEPNNATAQERAIFLSSLLDFQSQSMIYALGLLLSYVDKNWNAVALTSAQPKFLCIMYIMLKDIVIINEDAFENIGIIRTSQHPSFFKFGNASQSTSITCLYSLFNQCQSKPGAQCLWQILHHPTKDINVIKSRLEVIEFFHVLNNRVIADNLLSCLKNISQIPPAVLNITTALNAKPLDWYKLYETLRNVILIGEICQNQKRNINIFDKIVGSITEEMHFIKYFIEFIVDFDMSKVMKTIIVKSGVDLILDELNDLKERLPQILTEVGEKDIINLPNEVCSCRMVYFPDICYLLAITKWKGEPPADVEIPGMEFKFTINGIRHYKTARATELDETIGDVQMKISKRQFQIITRLARYISQQAGAILNAVRHCAELDVLLSFYTIALDHNYVKPNIVDSHIIAIKKGRHPVFEQTMTTTIPNDIYSGGGKSYVKIITGPNACGKSTYLKQVALIVFMAHLGSYVPAESATIGIIDCILVQMTKTKSASFNASLFVQDMRQATMIANTATAKSLVIMDEFGKNTSEIDGVALLTSILTDLIERGTNCPHIFAATHLHKALNLIPRTNIVELQTFEYIQQNESLSFLYRITSGSTTSSFAHSVAKMCAFDENFITNSLKVFDCIKRSVLPLSTSAVYEDQKRIITNTILAQLDPNAEINMEELNDVINQVIARRTI